MFIGMDDFGLSVEDFGSRVQDLAFEFRMWVAGMSTTKI